MEPHGQSPWHLTNAQAGRHPPLNSGQAGQKLAHSSTAKAVLARRSALQHAGMAFCCRGKSYLFPKLSRAPSVSSALRCIYRRVVEIWLCPAALAICWKYFLLVLSLILIIPFTLAPIISSSHFPIISFPIYLIDFLHLLERI